MGSIPTRSSGGSELINRIFFLPRDVAERIDPRDTWAIISISDPGGGADLKSGWKWRLNLNFDDIQKAYPGYVTFSYEQAEEVVNFLAKIAASTEVGTLFVHCEAGISRSAAVALFAQENFSTRGRIHGDHHNKFVKEVLDYQLKKMRKEGRFPEWPKGADS